LGELKRPSDPLAVVKVGAPKRGEMITNEGSRKEGREETEGVRPGSD